ncbi:MAG: HlyD family efflux transporter periplasmic adaptor subunit [Planctomycetota bacterium]
MSTLLAPRRSSSPFTHKDELSALKLVQSSVIARRLAKMTVVLLVLSMFAMLTLPWQQSARGTGKVTAYIPQERRQSVMAPVKGVVERVAEGIVEGSRVKEGQFIVEIAPQASDMAEQLELQLNDLKRKLETAKAQADVYSSNAKNLADARDLTVEAADELVKAAEAKLAAKKELLHGYKAKELQARLNYERHDRLARDGAKSPKQVEILYKDTLVAKAEFEAAIDDIEVAEKELVAKQKEREEKLKTAQTKVDYQEAMRQDALGKQATIQKDIRTLQIKQSEMERMVITAPRDGTIFRMPVFERGQTIKEGTELFDVVPETSDLVVELWLAGNDVPLVRVGDHVRLQFEGWPAIQFAGWPSVAVGTFGGLVAAIDETDDGKGKFRVQVRPDGEHEWPSHRFLRQGVRANGWVMLQRVRLGYEIWRQLNGFPPVVAEEEPSSKGDKDKKPKLPKN